MSESSGSDGGGCLGNAVLYVFLGAIALFGAISWVGGSVSTSSMRPNQNTTTTTTSTETDVQALSDWEALSRNQVNLFSRVYNFFDDATNTDGILSENELNLQSDWQDRSTTTTNTDIRDTGGGAVNYTPGSAIDPSTYPSYLWTMTNPNTGQLMCIDFSQGRYSPEACANLPTPAPTAP